MTRLIWSWLEQGFGTLVSDTNLKKKECNNLLTARDNLEVVDDLLGTACAKAFAYVSFPEAPLEQNRVSYWKILRKETLNN